MKKSNVQIFQKKLTPSRFSTFDEFHKYQKANAKFSRCIVTSPLFFHCENCCKKDNAIICVNCFDKSEHVGHDVSLIFSNKAFCDCGDDEFICPEKHCKKHRNVDANVNVDQRDLNAFKNCVRKLCELLSSESIAKNNKEFEAIIHFLKKLIKWGTFYLDVISDILIDGEWDNTFLNKILTVIDPFNIEVSNAFSNFCFSIVTSKKFQNGCTKFVNEIIQLLKRKFLLNINTDNAYFQALKIYHLFMSSSFVDIELEKQTIACTFQILKEIILQCIVVDENRQISFCVYDFSIIDIFFSIVRCVFEYPSIFLNSISTKNSNAIKEIINFVKMDNLILTIKRKEGEHELYDSHNYQKYIIFHRLLYCNIIHYVAPIFGLLSTNFNCPEFLIIPFELETKLLSENDYEIIENTALLLFDPLKQRMESINEYHSILFKMSFPLIDPFKEYFQLSYPLIDFINVFLTYTSLHNNIDPKIILQKIGFSEFDKLNAITASIVAGNSLINCDFFLANEQALSDVAKILEYDLDKISALQISAQITDDPEKFVAILTESFGILHWENVDKTDRVECERWTNSITLLCRLFVIISSDIIFSGYKSSRFITDLIIQYIYFGINTVNSINRKLSKLKIEKEELYKVLLKVADFHQNINEATLTLKNEYADKPNDFLYINSSSFFKKIGESHKETLLILPKNEFPECFSRVKSFLKTNSMLLLINKILSAPNEITSYSLKRIVFALVRFIIQEFPETGELFVNDGIIDLLIKNILSIENGRKLLESFLQEVIELPKIYELINIRLQSSAQTKTQKKIDQKSILKKFKEMQNSFANSNSKELSKILNDDSDSKTCVFCGEPFDDIEPYGLLADIYKSNILSKVEKIIANDSLERYQTTCKINTCGHLAHFKCFVSDELINNNLNIGFSENAQNCPLDRQMFNTIIPYCNEVSIKNAFLQEILNFIDNIFLLCDISICQTIAYNISLIEILSRTNPKCLHDKRIFLGIIYLIRIAIFFDNQCVSETSDIFSLFTIELFKCSNLENCKESFPELIKKFWKLFANSASVQTPELQISCFEVFVRRVSLLYQITFHSDETITLPTINEFIEQFSLSSPSDVLKDACPLINEITFVTPFKEFYFPNLCENFIDYLDHKLVKFLKNENFIFAKCMFCGKICCIKNKTDIKNSDLKVDDLFDHFYKCTELTVILFLILNGEDATTVRIFDADFGSYDFGPIYYDKFGDSDIGLYKNNALTLNKLRVKKLIETLLKGEYRSKFITYT